MQLASRALPTCTTTAWKIACRSASNLCRTVILSNNFNPKSCLVGCELKARLLQERQDITISDRLEDALQDILRRATNHRHPSGKTYDSMISNRLITLIGRSFAFFLKAFEERPCPKGLVCAWIKNRVDPPIKRINGHPCCTDVSRFHLNSLVSLRLTAQALFAFAKQFLG